MHWRITADSAVFIFWIKSAQGFMVRFFSHHTDQAYGKCASPSNRQQAFLGDPYKPIIILFNLISRWYMTVVPTATQEK